MVAQQDLEKRLQTVQEIVQGYVDRQGHDRCWYLPELFDALAIALDISVRHPTQLPPIEKFRSGCARYTCEQYQSTEASDKTEEYR